MYVASVQHRRRRRRYSKTSYYPKTKDSTDIDWDVPDAMPWVQAPVPKANPPRTIPFMPGLGDGPHANGNLARQPAVHLRPQKLPMQLIKPKVRSGCAEHIHDGIVYCYILEPDECTRPDIEASVEFKGSPPHTGPAYWLRCDALTGLPLPEILNKTKWYPTTAPGAAVALTAVK